MIYCKIIVKVAVKYFRIKIFENISSSQHLVTVMVSRRLYSEQPFLKKIYNPKLSNTDKVTSLEHFTLLIENI